MVSLDHTVWKNTITESKAVRHNAGKLCCLSTGVAT